MDIILHYFTVFFLALLTLIYIFYINFTILHISYYSTLHCFYGTLHTFYSSSYTIITVLYIDLHHFTLIWQYFT